MIINNRNLYIESKAEIVKIKIWIKIFIYEQWEENKEWIILLITFICFIMRTCDATNFTYHFYNNPSGGDTPNSYSTTPVSPYFRSPWSDLRRELSVTSNTPIWTRQGVMLVEGSALWTVNLQTMATPAAYTVILWVYVYEDIQTSWLFGKGMYFSFFLTW